MRRDDLQSDHAKAGLPLTALALCLALLGGCSSTPFDFVGGGGEELMAQYRTPSHEVDYRTAGLTPPPLGLRWFRVDRNYVLANRTTGLIIRTVPIAPNADPPTGQ